MKLTETTPPQEKTFRLDMTATELIALREVLSSALYDIEDCGGCDPSLERLLFDLTYEEETAS